MEKFLLIGGIAALVIGLIALVAWVEHKRKKAIEALFTSRGDSIWIKPTQEQKAAALDAIGNPPELKDGPGGVKWAAEAATAKPPLWIVEHSYSRGAGKSRRTYTHTMVVTPVPPTWATTAITRVTLWNKLQGLLGKKGMQLDSEAFNKAFQVTTDDENFALVLLTPALQEWLLSTPRDWSIRVTQGLLQVYVPRATAVKLLPPMLDAPAQILARTTPELFAA